MLSPPTKPLCAIIQPFLCGGELYLVVSHMAKNDYDRAIRKIYKYSAVEPKAHLSLQTKNHDCGAEIKHFVQTLEK